MANIPGLEGFETPVKHRAGVRGNYKGHEIEVATGYDIVSDSYPVHISVDGQKPSGVTLDRYRSYDDAVQAGVEAAKRVIDSQFRVPGFQRTVER